MIFTSKEEIANYTLQKLARALNSGRREYSIFKDVNYYEGLDEFVLWPNDKEIDKELESLELIRLLIDHLGLTVEEGKRIVQKSKQKGE